MTDAERTEQPDRAATGPGPLPDRVRARVVGLAADALGRMAVEVVPPSLVRVATFAPQRRARLAASQIASVLAADDAFRDRVATDVRVQVPDLAQALDAGTAPSAADPVDLAAVAYLLRPPGWADLVEAAGEAAVAEESATTRGHASRQVEQLRRQVESLTESLKDTRARQREQVAALKAENSELRHKLGDARGRVRAAEEAATASATAADEARAGCDRGGGPSRGGGSVASGRGWRSSNATSPPYVARSAPSATPAPCVRGCSWTRCSTPPRGCGASSPCRPWRARRPTPSRRTSPSTAPGPPPATGRWPPTTPPCWSSC